MLTVRTQQMGAMNEAGGADRNVQPCEDTKTWIEIELLDEEGNPVPGAKYRVLLPDSAQIEGSLDDKGKARVDNIIPGTCTVEFPEFDGREWRGA